MHILVRCDKGDVQLQQGFVTTVLVESCIEESQYLRSFSATCSNKSLASEGQCGRVWLRLFLETTTLKLNFPYLIDDNSMCNIFL